MDPKSNDCCLYKRKEKDIWTHRDVGEKAVWRQRQNLEWCSHKLRNAWNHQKLEEQGRILPCGLWRDWTRWHLDFVYSLGLWKNKFLLSEPTKIVVICYSSPRKLIEMSNVKNFLSSLLPPCKHGDLLNNHLPWRMRHRVELWSLQLWKKSLLLSQLWKMGADLLKLLSERALVWFQPQWNKWEFQSCSGTQTNTWMTFLQNFHWLRKRHFFRILFIVLHFEWLEFLELCEQQNALDRPSGAEGGTAGHAEDTHANWGLVSLGWT